METHQLLDRHSILSNKEEASLLGKATYRREIAKAIYEAIIDYKNANE